MKVSSSAHLSYCTNIHAGEHWQEVWASLKEYTLPLKKRLSPNNPFGLGLRLSDVASREILEQGQLSKFNDWLQENGLYVFTFNGFPYGGFHRTRVKDDVHRPDWCTRDRLNYTIRLFDILAYLLPEGLDGGISTSPLSYRHWYKDAPKQLEDAWHKGCAHFAEVAAHLHHIKTERGIHLHLDIEPEPDGLLENTREVIDFYRDRLFPAGGRYLQEKLSIDQAAAEEILREHIQICYDVCHFAVMYETPADTFREWAAAGIRVGKVQISAALKAQLPAIAGDRSGIEAVFQKLNESTYLHQVVARRQDGAFRHFNDLPEALQHIRDPQTAEWRTHFHVPIFIDRYDQLEATIQPIEESLRHINSLTNHWEVETYTWEVLPESIRIGLLDSIERELRWVLTKLEADG